MTRPPILDPRAVPVTGIDADLPPVPADRLTPQSLRERSGKSARIKEKLTAKAAA